ncbi:hypothetical protein BkAM31D_09195 [Halalkalibacter krulwichiae]|uniref:Uncharacterized protein n=1 Tax=Halalkalibacter krulwichiae TaxID=199441 RepID=A0A1X9MBQ1_9BACI|nr:hypothetical protein BkAM31D_09195 [Halalkalibacter krulwichiae]
MNKRVTMKVYDRCGIAKSFLCLKMKAKRGLN